MREADSILNSTMAIPRLGRGVFPRLWPAFVIAMVMAVGVAGCGTEEASAPISASDTSASSQSGVDERDASESDSSASTADAPSGDAEAEDQPDVSTKAPSSEAADDDDTPSDGQRPASSEADSVGDQTLVLAKVDVSVTDALLADNQVDVLVSLVSADDDSALAAAQQSVLAEVDPSQFRVKRTYKRIPAISGTVLGVDALQLLADHPDVVFVALDLPAEGQSTG